MARKFRPQDLSESDLRKLMIEKRRASRQKRLDNFRQTGRLVELAHIPSNSPATNLGEPDITHNIPAAEADTRQIKRKSIVNRALLSVEMLAIVGLVFIILNGVGIVQRLNQELTSVLIGPTFTSTPLISAVVLPSGHTIIPGGGVKFNDAEIPEHLRPLAQAYSQIAFPTPSAEQAIRIEIPAINVAAPIVIGDSFEQLKQGVGQHLGSANPGDNGNLVLSAHNDVFGQIFRHLDKLSSGDRITVFTNLRAYTYEIDLETLDTLIVEPTFVQVMDPTADSTVTLISCYPYLVNSQRIVVRAILVEG